MREDIIIINALLDSLMTVFETMGRVRPRAAGADIKESDVALGAVSGLMEMESANARGSMALSFTAPVIAHLGRSVLPEDYDDGDADDLVGEITNMVVGGAKGLLEEQGYDFDMARPVVLTGEGHRISHIQHGQTVLVPFVVEAGEFYLEINFTDY